MKKFVAIAALGALAACGNPAEEADEPIVAESPAPTVQDRSSAAGTYEVTMADGTKVTQTLRRDGTYSDVADGEVTETGSWRMEGDSLCYDPEGNEAEQCFASGAIGADGSFEARDADGNVNFTVRRIGDEDMATTPTA